MCGRLAQGNVINCGMWCSEYPTLLYIVGTNCHCSCLIICTQIVDITYAILDMMCTEYTLLCNKIFG